jgi:hypothetical protein
MLWEKPRSSWAWKLVPLKSGRTRLISRLKQRYDAKAKRVDKGLGDSFLFVRPEYKISREMPICRHFSIQATGHDWAMSALGCA